jgi:hypothetical protein
MTEPEMFTTEWRAEQVTLGMEALAMAETYNGTEQKMFYVAVAQAYFQAANIRSRPGESARTLDPTKVYVDRFGNLMKDGKVIGSSAPEEKL